MRLGVAALVAAGAVGAVAVQGAAADASALQSLSTTALPANVDHSLTLLASACASRWCVTTGRYADSSHVQHSLIISSTDGVVTSAVQGPSPAGSTYDPNLTSVGCASSGMCIAVGAYGDAAGHTAGVVVPIQDGVPQGAYGLALPVGTTYSELGGVACTTTGSCLAVGEYTDTSTAYYGIVVPIGAGGVPGTPIQVLEPSSSTAGVQDSWLNDVSCQGQASCVAVGSYQIDAGADYGAEVVSITSGTPAAAQAIASPTNAPPPAANQNVDVEHVACPGTGTCAAAGTYLDSSSLTHDIVVPITNGVPGTPALTTPPQGATTAHIAVGGLSCQASSWCVEVGRYSTSDGYRTVVVPIDNGVATGDVESSLPADAYTGAGGQSAELESVSCPPLGGACLAAGHYDDAHGNQAAMTTTFDGGVIGTGIAAPTPADEYTVAPGDYLAELGCASSSCAATGVYPNATGQSTVMVLSSQAPLTIGTAALPGGAAGTAYSQTVSAAGAWGVYSWSVTSGSLPAGLSLNALTGVISGTPTAGGTSGFTLTATATGIPVQTASKSYSVTVTAAPAKPTPTPSAEPVLKLLASSATVTKNKVGLVLSCSTAACNGALKLQITRTVTVRHGKKKLHKHVTVRIANGGFSLAAAQTRTVTVTLNAVGRRTLAASHRLNATVLDTMAGVKQTLGHVTLKPAPVKHKKKH